MHNPTTIKNFGLCDFYLKLSCTDKQVLFHYTRHMEPTNLSKVQFLWMGAANLIPQGYYALAQQMLLYALSLASHPDDLAYIHANLAQSYFDQLEQHPDYQQKCYYHCTQVKSQGYFQNWIKDMLNRLSDDSKESVQLES